MPAGTGPSKLQNKHSSKSAKTGKRLVKKRLAIFIEWSLDMFIEAGPR